MRIDAPPAPTHRVRERMSPPPTAATPAASPLTPVVVMPAAAGDDTVVSARSRVPLWASVVVFVLALATFGVQLALYLAPGLE